VQDARHFHPLQHGLLLFLGAGLRDQKDIGALIPFDESAQALLGLGCNLTEAARLRIGQVGMLRASLLLAFLCGRSRVGEVRVEDAYDALHVYAHSLFAPAGGIFEKAEALGRFPVDVAHENGRDDPLAHSQTYTHHLGANVDDKSGDDGNQQAPPTLW